jgi:hypothetical protein
MAIHRVSCPVCRTQLDAALILGVVNVNYQGGIEYVCSVCGRAILQQFDCPTCSLTNVLDLTDLSVKPAQCALGHPVSIRQRVELPRA